MDLLEPDAHDGVAPMGVMSTFGGNQVAMAAGIATLEKLTPDVHDRVNALGDRTRTRIDAIARRYDIPLHATGMGHLIGIDWAEERVVDYRTRMLDDREKIVNINLALDNEGYYQTFTGLFLLSTAVGDQEIDGFLLALERSLHLLGYVT